MNTFDLGVHLSFSCKDHDGNIPDGELAFEFLDGRYAIHPGHEMVRGRYMVRTFF